jgi:hypothetical protein
LVGGGKMKKMRVIDLFNIKYDAMGTKINFELEDIQKEGHEIIDTKVIGESLNKCAVFVLYEEK